MILGSVERVSYRDAYSRIEQLSQGLLNLKLPANSCIPLVSENNIFFIITYFSITKSGHVCVPLDPKTTVEQFNSINLLCEVKLAFIQSKHLEKFSQDSFCKIFTEENYASLNKGGMDVANTNKDDTAVILFTSGSTGEPKGVMLTHGNFISNAESILNFLPITSSDILEMVLPFYYSFGLSALHTHVHAGGAIVINNKFMFPSSVIKHINEYQCTAFYGVPSHFQILMRNTTFLKTAMPSLKYLAQAGGKLAVTFVEELGDALPEVRLFLMYGATEATARLTYLEPEMLSKKASSIGKAISGVSLKIVKANGSEAQPHEVGEIRAAGANIMKGYFKDPESTRAVLQDGWLRTGDLAKSDEAGYIFIVDRERDFIKSAGYRISSKEIEDIILQNKNILEVAVIGIYDELIGEAVCAYVVAKSGVTVSKEQIVDDCLAKLASHKIPRSVIILDSLPKGSNGKYLKVELRRLQEMHKQL